MKRKLQFLTKTLLVAAGLLAGSMSAWATDVPYNVGSSTSDAWGTGFSDVWTLTGDGAVTVTFTNHCATDGNWWDNWQLLCGNEDFTPAAHDDANRKFQMRSDRWDDAAGSAVGFIMSDDYFTDFKTFQNGATVTLKIVRSGTTVTVNTSVTKDATTRTITFVKTGLDGTLNFFLTQSLSYVTITAQDQTTEMAGTVSCNVLMNFDNYSYTDNETSITSYTGGKGTMSLYNSFVKKITEGSSYRISIRNSEANGDNNNVSLSSSEYAGSKDIVTVSFDMDFVAQTGSDKSSTIALRDASNNNIAYITVTTNYSGTGTAAAKAISTNLGVTSDDIITNRPANWTNKVHFTITLNYLTQKITTTTACAGAKNTTSTHTVDMTNTNPLAKFHVGAGYNYNLDYRPEFDNLLIQTELGDYNTTANITLAFEDNDGADISALYTGTTAFTPDKSTTFTPSDYYPAVMYDEDYKYTYTSGGDAFTVTGDATVTLVYTKSARPTYTFNVTANYGAKSQKIVDGVSVKEAADYTYYYPRFIKDGTTLYEYASSTDANALANYWSSTHTNVAANGTFTLTYNAIEGECVYYSEGEDIASKTGTYTYANWKQYMSNGSAGVFSAGALTTLDAGVYTVTARVVGRATDRFGYIYKTSVAEENKLLTVVSANSGNEGSQTFSVAASTEILAEGGYAGETNNGHGFDYIYIMKLPASESVTVTAAGYATYVSAYNLDFTSTSIKAYEAKVSAGKVVLTPINKVQAGTGVVLYKEGGATEDIPVCADYDAASNNELVAGTGAAVATTDGSYTNYILNNVSGSIGFYKANAQTVASNRAYLHTLTANISGGAPLYMFFNDSETTGINAVKGAEFKVNGEYYNLAGQRVAQPTKGLYIVNGRKVVIK